MLLSTFTFVVLLCIIYQSNGNICSIYGCKQNSPSDILEENLTLTTGLKSCVMARNYDGLSFSVVLENNVYQRCSWIFASTFLDPNRNCVNYSRSSTHDTSPFNQENIFTSFAPCANRSSSRSGIREITCVMSNRKKYSSIVFASIPYNDFFVSVECDGKYSKGFRIRGLTSIENWEGCDRHGWKYDLEMRTFDFWSSTCFA